MSDHPIIPPPFELASIANDLWNDCETFDQADLLACVLDKLTERNPKAKRGEYKWQFELTPNGLQCLSELLQTLAEGLTRLDMKESNYVMECMEEIWAILQRKADKATGRA